MRTDSARGNRGAQSRPGADRPAESLSTQIAVALGYTVVIIVIATAVLGSFTDDFGLEQAGVGFLPIAAVALAVIRRKAR